MPVVKPAKNTEREKKVKIARAVVEKCSGFGEDVNWGAGIRAFNALYKRYPDLDFWHNFKPFPKQYPVYVYLGGKGAEYVKKQYDQYLLEKTEKNRYNLEEEAVGPINVSRKPVSLIDFLKGNYPKTL